MSARLLITREDRVLRLTLNDPERHNALGRALSRDLVDALFDAGKDRTVGCILVDAAGQAFSSGFDYEGLLAPDAEQTFQEQDELMSFGLHYHKPIVASVQGPAYGAGVGLLANCQVVIAAQTATLGLTDIRAGYWPFAAWRALVTAIGERRAAELSLTGRVFSAGDAVTYGLVHETAPAFELDDRATQVARQLAYASQESLRRGLDFIQKTRGLGWAEAGEVATEYSARTVRSADFVEGARAFREKRRPDWPSLK
jgi:methylglutaconyl-CoA hydratase